MTAPGTFHHLSTGVPGLDTILGGGVPEFSFNLITGPPGSGKTTLAHQIMFSLATRERGALFFTVFGEPLLKMLRYQQQFSFFDLDKINDSIRFVDLSEDVAASNSGQALERIAEEFAATSPGLVFVDSFASIMPDAMHKPRGVVDLQQVIHQLGVQLSGWQATSFMIRGNHLEGDSHPVLTMADGIFSLSQNVQRNSMVRKVQIPKMRGQATLPGVHTFRITGAGIQVFPATVAGDARSVRALAPGDKTRLTMGVPRLDAMLGGGLPSGYSLLVAGPSGSGKSILAASFLSEGVRLNEPGVIVAFEQTHSQSWTLQVGDMLKDGKVGLINAHSLDLSMDEVLAQLTQMIHRMKAKRVVFDSLSGFELAAAPSFREDFRESLFRMVAVLSGLGVTLLMTSELEDRYTDLRFSPYGSAFLTDAIIVQRYIEVESCLRRVIAVVKVRASAHSTEIRQFEITDAGVVIGDPVAGYEGLLGGRPKKIS